MRYGKPLPREEQIALCALAQQGDGAARDRLVVTSMGLVYSRANFYSGRSKDTPLDDLVSAGTVGLPQAAPRPAPAPMVKVRVRPPAPIPAPAPPAVAVVEPRVVPAASHPSVQVTRPCWACEKDFLPRWPALLRCDGCAAVNAPVPPREQRMEILRQRRAVSDPLVATAQVEVAAVAVVPVEPAPAAEVPATPRRVLEAAGFKVQELQTATGWVLVVERGVAPAAAPAPAELAGPAPVQTWWERRKARGVCMCGRQARPGLATCGNHRKTKQQRSEAYHKALAAGMCQSHVHTPAEPGSTRCPKCNGTKRAIAERAREARRASGWCVICGRRRAFVGEDRCNRCSAGRSQQVPEAMAA
jgi:hypothetical protein